MQQHLQAALIVCPTTFWIAFRRVQAGLPHRLHIECSNDSGLICSSLADYSQLRQHHRLDDYRKSVELAPPVLQSYINPNDTGCK
jgi:hypothetical protein